MRDPLLTTLEDVPLFQGLTGDALAAIVGEAVRREARAGEVFFREGDPADAFFVVVAGSVKLAQVSPAGHVVVLRLVGAGAAFGGAAAFGEAEYPVTAEAASDATVLEWTGTAMAALMERHPRFALNLLRFIAARLRDLQVQFRQLATERVERRVAHALLRLVQHAGRRVEAGVLIDLPLTREDVAQMTGTTLYTVSRILSGWESAGILDSGRHRIIVRKPHALVAIAEELD